MISISRSPDIPIHTEIYRLTRRGKGTVPYLKRMDSDKRQILKIAGKR